MTLERESDVDVLIQGAGIGGLTLAIAMFRKGHSVKIVERASGLSEIGAGIWMAANPMQVFDRLGFAEKIVAAGRTIHRIILEDFKGGLIQVSSLSDIAKIYGFETVALHRSVLQRVLFQELPDEVITFGTEVKRLSQSVDAVSVVLGDGSRMRAKIVVGADGIYSQMRQLISLGGEMRYSGSSSYRAIARGVKLLAPDLDHNAYEIWGKGCRIGFSKINSDDYYWYMTFDSEQNKMVPPAERLVHAASICREFFPRWIGLLENTQPGEILQTDISDLKRLPKWSNGRIGLIGDAAHATTPNLGQGGAMAIEDAYALTYAVEEEGLNEKAFELYEQRRRAKVDWIVSTSWTIGKIGHIKNPVLRALRNIILRKMPSEGGEKQIRKLYSIE